MSEGASTAQKGFVRSLVRKAELDPRTITLAYRKLKGAEAFIGESVDRWIDSLSKVDASVVINQLKAMTEDDDD
jgi:hypothetical protein